jgi:hypothetical protein
MKINSIATTFATFAIAGFAHAEAPKPSFTEPQARLVVDQVDADNVAVLAPTYTARFGPDGAVYSPFLGATSTKQASLRMRLGAATIGGRDIEVLPRAGATLVEGVASFERGLVDEAYEISLGSIEQTFVVGSHPGAGDLRLRVAIDTALAARAESDGFSFRDSDGEGVSFGAAAVRNQDGSLTSVPTHLVDGGVEIVVPSELLDAATYPLVVDPVVSSLAIEVGASIATEADAAYDLVSNTWTVVYQVQAAAGNGDVYCRIYDASTMALRATRILDATTEDWTGPKIANSRAGARHLVVATRKASSTTAPMIVGRFVYPGNNDVGPVGAISTGSLDCANPDIGGSNGTSTSGAQFCVVYSRTFSDFRVDVVAKRLSMTGLAVGAESIVSGGTEQFNERPAISNVHDGSGWAIAFERMGWDASGPYCKQVWGAQLALTGAVAGPVAVSTLVVSRTNAFDTVTTCVLPRTEANMRWIVGYTRQLAGNPDVELVSLNGLGIRATSSAHAVRGASSALLEAQPSLAFAGGSNIALAFTSTTAAGVGARIIYTRIPMITAGLLVGTFGTANNTTYVSPTGSACVQPVLGSRLENGATGNADFFVAWTVQGVLDIRGVLFRAL